MNKSSLYILLLGVALSTVLRAQTFEDVSAEAGVEGYALDPAVMAGGVVWFDYDGDYYPDLLLVNGTLPSRLYRNNWDGTFKDVSEASGLLSTAGIMGAVSADFDADGHTDLFLTTLEGQPNFLLRNNGSGSFQRMDQTAGMTQTAYSSSATVGDPDGDGDPDIYVANYMAGTDPMEGGQPNFYFRNEGNFAFTEMATDLGLDNGGCGLGAVFTDLDGDCRQDIYVANDFGYLILPNELYLNGQEGYQATADANGSAAPINAMGIAKGDYDNDGDVDLYVTNIRENPLFENMDNGIYFSYASARAGVALPDLTSWGTSFTDFDLDGWLDLVVANGQVAEVDNQPEPITYFLNDRTGGFTDASLVSDLAEVEVMARGLAVADFNLDGLPDIAVNAVRSEASGTETARLLRNNGPTDGSWLAIEAPFGALDFSLYLGETILRREVDGGSSYLSHSGGPVHFGVPGERDRADSLVVRFTNGRVRTYLDVSLNGLIGIHEAGGWYRIRHESTTNCSTVPTTPELQFSRTNTGTDSETLLVSQLLTVDYPQLPAEQIVLPGDGVFRGVAYTRDTILVDTVAGTGSCPSLRPLELRVRPSVNEAVIFPNPFTDQLSIDLPTGVTAVRFDLFSTLGAQVFHQDLTYNNATTRVTVPLSSLPAGSYLCRIEYAGGTTQAKLIRQ